jgi:ParB/RepB/Spo0J family partition protein
MKIEQKPIQITGKKLHANPWNPNKTTPRQQAAIGESLGLFGQVLPLVVRPHPEIDGEYQIIDGEHRFLANAENDEVWVNVIEVDDVQAQKLTIVLNETRGTADKLELSQLLAQLSEQDDDLLTGLPYTESELDELIKLVDLDWDSFDSEFSDDGDGGGGDESWHSYLFKVSDSAQSVIEQALDLLRDAGVGKHQDPTISLGQLIEALAAEYIALPGDR